MLAKMKLLLFGVQVVKETIDPSATIEYKENTADDPHKRKPDISRAKDLLNWEPKISLREGLPRMVSDFQNRILNEDEGKGQKQKNDKAVCIERLGK